MIPTLKKRRIKMPGRPTKAFKQRYGHLMMGLGASLGLAANAVLPPVPATPVPSIDIVLPGEDGVGIGEIEQVGRDVILYKTDGHHKRLYNVQGLDGDPGKDGEDGQDGQGDPGKDGIGLDTAVIVDKDLLVFTSDEKMINAGRVVGEDGLPGKNADPAEPGKDGEDGEDGDPGVGIAKMWQNGEYLFIILTNGVSLPPMKIVGKPGKKGGKGKKGDPGKDGKIINKTYTIHEKLDYKVRLEFDRSLRRLRVGVGKKWSGWVVIPGGGGGGLAEVATDDTLTGDGTSGSPLSVVGGGGAVVTDDSLSGDGTAGDPLSVEDSEIDHLLIVNRGENTHVQIDTHLANMANPHNVTAEQTGADLAGSAEAVQDALDFHEDDFTNPHVVTAGQTGADPLGSAAAVEALLTTHEADLANPHAVSAAQAGADPAGTAAAGDTAHLGDFVHADISLNTIHRGLVTGNPHVVTLAEVGGDPAGSAAAVQDNLDIHEGDTANPHVVTAAQAGADPAGSAATVQGNLNTHTGDTDIHVAHSGVTLTAGVGLTGGGDITANRTFNLEDTAVTPASYTRASITVDQQGRITAASSGSAPAVDSVFGRTGVVVAVADDYTWAEIDKTVSDIADIATKSHSSLDSLVAPADDHTQYHTNARGDARYALLLHAPRHTDGNDDIQDAGAAQKGLLTSGAQTIGGIKTFNANILPVASIIFQTGGTDLDLATNAARFFPHRASQEGQPTPASGELMMWYKPTGGRVRLVYNDPVGGVKDVMLA